MILKGTKVNLLDPGAGIGMLSTVFCEVAFKQVDKIDVTAIEIDDTLNSIFEENLCLINEDRDLIFKVLNTDFIEWASTAINEQLSLFNLEEKRYSHIIMNPPYKKFLVTQTIERFLKKLVLILLIYIVLL